MSLFSNDVYQRSGNDEMTRNAFYLILGAVVTWGFLAASIVAEMTLDWHPGRMMFLLVGLGIPIIGILLGAAGNAVLSFIGFNLVAIPMGAILGPFIGYLELTHPGVVHQSALLTAAITAIMGASGVLFPNFYKGLGGTLFVALCSLLVVGLLGMFIPALAHMPIISWIGAGIFALYVGFDMWRASTVPATAANAMEVAMSLFLDIFNIFVHIASALANSSSDD